MNFLKRLETRLSDHFLLRHPFYTKWTEGGLEREQLGAYARQYFHHVDAFPRYLSATHSRCPDIVARQVLLENLCDEEAGSEHHPELWMRFAEGVGTSREEVRAETPLAETESLVATFFERAYGSYEEGLGALFAYERQVPAVAEQKIESLRRHYGVSDERSLQFFRVHLEADVHHAHATQQLMARLSPEAQERAEEAAVDASRALWRFLDGVERL